MAWLVYQHHGDTRILAEHFDGFKAWVDFLTTQTENAIVQYSYYGDWAPPVGESITGSEGASAISMRTPGKLMSTAYYYYSAWLLAQMARVIGRDAEACVYSQLAEQISQAYNNCFWDEAAGGYASNNQACNAISLWMGLVPVEKIPRVVANLVRDVVELHDGHLTTGNLCSKYLLEVLTQYGHGDVAYRVAVQETYPSWGYMLANGATTCWERWEWMTGGGMNSHNHPMLASVGSWLYKALAGIAIDPVDPAAPGFARFTLRPLVTDDLTFVRASLETPRGPVRTAWERDEGHFSLHVEVPVGSQAQIRLPEAWSGSGIWITETGRLIWKEDALVELPDGILHASRDGACVIFTTGSGVYDFVCTQKK
jgi:alpha-L-rhamnosidase